MARITITREDAQQTDKAALGLLPELRKLAYVHRVERPAVPETVSPTPPGTARSADVIALGTVLATLAFTPEIIGGFLSYLGEWAHRPGRSRGPVRIEVEIDGNSIGLDKPTPEERAALIKAFLEALEQQAAQKQQQQGRRRR